MLIFQLSQLSRFFPLNLKPVGYSVSSPQRTDATQAQMTVVWNPNSLKLHVLINDKADWSTERCL